MCISKRPTGHFQHTQPLGRRALLVPAPLNQGLTRVFLSKLIPCYIFSFFQHFPGSPAPQCTPAAPQSPTSLTLCPTAERLSWRPHCCHLGRAVRQPQDSTKATRDQLKPAKVSVGITSCQGTSAGCWDHAPRGRVEKGPRSTPRQPGKPWGAGRLQAGTRGPGSCAGGSGTSQRGQKQRSN